MPPPRKSPMRHRQRRSRSRSYSPRRRSRSGSRSLSRSGRDRRRSRSPQRKRSPERKYRSPHRRSPSPRRRSRSPKRRSRSRSPRSKFPQRRSRSLSPRRKSSPPRRLSSSRRISPRREASPKQLSPLPENYPVKRPADSSMKRQSYRSPSPSPVKRAKEERVSREKSPVEKSRYSRHSPSPERAGTSFERAKYADQPSSSKKPLFPAASSKVEIDFVTILDKGQKKEKLNKRFETLEQVAHGPFDFEENITIGIHRGPQHIELDEDEDMEINYEFNPKTFKMLFPKKEYLKPIFERDEIKAFRHDEILDEEAYVEKRTISVKPVEKPKSRKYEDELDYKVTVDRDREGLGDRRMVHDSRAGSKPSRSRYHDDVPVTVRLDPKPDPRYEKMYREQQRFEDQSLMQEKVQRNPNDLRYSLMRRKSDGDWDRGLVDARSRIEARRQEGHGDEYHSRPTERRVSSFDRKKLNSKTELPDFKNRPEKFKEPEWKFNPLVTPKGESYYEHDSRSRDDMTFWERKQMFLKTGRYPSRRGLRGRGFRGFRGGRGSYTPGFLQRSSGAGAMDEWKHDKFDEVKNDDESKDSGKERKGSKEKKSDRKERKDTKDNKDRAKSGEKSKRDTSSKRDKEKSQAEKDKESSAIRREEESLQNELKVEVTIG